VPPRHEHITTSRLAGPSRRDDSEVGGLMIAILDIGYWISSIQDPTSNIKYPTSNISPGIARVVEQSR
jgi:hypothetical protein